MITTARENSPGRLFIGGGWRDAVAGKTIDDIHPAAPFGGFKQSGCGKECGKHVLENFTRVKDVWVNLA